MDTNLSLEFKDCYEDIFFEEEFNLGKFYRATRKNSGEAVYLKIYSKDLLKKSNYNYLLKQLEKEVGLSELCKSEHVLKIYQKKETENAILLEYEFYESDLIQYITHNGEMMNDKEFFKKVVRELVEALKVLYDKKVIHRDIKPNNIFLIKKENEDEEEEYTIKLGNFSSSILLKENDNRQIGTIAYTPPEMFKNMNYNEKVDLWSLGVTLYHIYMGYTPYGSNVNLNLIKHSLYGKNFIYIFSDNTCLNILFKKLMSINPKDRMTHKEFFEYVLDKDFMAPNESFNTDKYKDIVKEIEVTKSSDKYQKLLQNLQLSEKKECHSDIVILQEQIEKIVNIVTVDNLPNLMNFSKGDLDTKTKFNNLVYYDENIQDYLDSINSDSDFFEGNTFGDFLLCNDLKSLDLIMFEIKKKFDDDNQVKFNLIVTGSKCEKVMEHLGKNHWDNIFENVCIYCINVNKYLPLQKKYKKIYGVYSDPSQVVDYIKKFSSESIKPFRTTKLVTFEEYKLYYYYWHKIVSLFYGDLTKERFNDYIGKMGSLVDKEDKNKALKFSKNVVLNGFKEFNIDKDLEELDKRIIKGYTGNTYYGDINKWLMNFSLNSFQEVAYFTARLMFSLNNYGKKNKYFCQNTELYRGVRIPFSSLLAYKRAKGKIIILSAFTSSSEDKEFASGWAGRDTQKSNYDGLFSVVFIIKNIWKKEWISNGIDLQEVTHYKEEKEILFEPFTFCHVDDVVFDVKKYTADIYLETIGKTEILENAIKNGKKIEYNKELNIMEVKH